MHQTITQFWSLAGWTLLHYVWVGVAFTCFAQMGRMLLRRAPSQVRYAYALACFAGLALAPILVLVGVVQTTPVAQRLASVEPVVIAPIELLGEKNATDALLVNTNLAPSAIATDAPAVQQSWRAVWNASHWMSRLAYWAPVGWLAGFPIACVWISTGLIGAERLRRRSQLLLEGPIVVACARLKKTLGVRRAPRVGVCEQITRPILIGIVRPMILLPPAALAGWTSEQLEVVLLHELAHIRRGDNLISLLQRIAEAMLFFQPGVWIISSWLRLEREHCCDEAVVRQTHNARFYAETLVFIAGLTRPGAAVGEPWVWQTDASSAMAQNHLVTRIRRILHKEQNMKRPMFDMRTSRRWEFSLMFLFAAALVVAGSWRPLGGPEESVARAEEVNQNEPSDQRQQPVAGEDSVREINAPASPTNKSRLRYDGKTFSDWTYEWETELNPARHVVAIEAFAAFAQNGYGEEAVRAIFNVMRRYDMSVIDNSPEGKLKSTASNVFSKIDRKHWERLITEALESKKRREVIFALQITFRDIGFTKASLPHLLTLMRGPDPQIAISAINTMNIARPQPPEFQKALRQLLLSKQPSVVRVAATALTPGGRFYGGGGGVFGGGIFGGSGGGFGGGGVGGGAMQPLPASEYFPELVEALKTADSQTTLVLYKALQLGPNGKLATPALVELLQQEEPAKTNALGALMQIGQPAVEAAPAILLLLNDQHRQVRFAALRAVIQIIPFSQNDALTGTIVETLKKPYQEHPDLRLPILHLWTRLGPKAAVAVKDILEAAKNDPNSQVRTEAANLLLRMHQM